MPRNNAGDKVLYTEARCAFCHGIGKDPFGIMSSISTCCVCGGAGSVKVPKPSIPCAHCRGTGAIKTFTCTACGGKGVILRPASALVRCPVCRGTGDDSSASAMACLRCRGRGFVAG